MIYKRNNMKIALCESVMTSCKLLSVACVVGVLHELDSC